MPRCASNRADGERCTKGAVAGSPWCFMHDPKRQEEVAAARRRGAEATKRRHSNIRTVDLEDTPGQIDTLADVATWLRWCAVAVATGKIDARTGHEVIVSLKELRPTLEKVGLEEEVRKLRAELAAARQGRGS